MCLVIHGLFQPLLNENFEPRELQDMNEMVLRQHNLFRAKVKSEKSLKQVRITIRKDGSLFDV